nr:hypothetical protein [Tanacetum cinerariifolium]
GVEVAPAVFLAAPHKALALVYPVPAHGALFGVYPRLVGFAVDGLGRAGSRGAQHDFALVLAAV